MSEERDADEHEERTDADEPSAEDEPAGAETDAESEGDEPVAEEERLPLSALRDRVEAGADAGHREDAPLAAVAQEAEAVGDEERSGLFEEVDVGDIDGEAVWDAVVEGEVDPGEVLGEEPRAPPEVGPAAEPTAEPDEHVVEKREYCQRCEFFAEPPDATCTHDGTEIVELVDNDRFRVRGCPKVAVDDEALEGFTE